MHSNITSSIYYCRVLKKMLFGVGEGRIGSLGLADAN